MSSIFFTVESPIVGKQRPRFNRFTGRTYTPSKTHKYEDVVKAAYISKYPSGMWVQNKEQPISIVLDIHYKMPDGWSKKKKANSIGKYCLKHIDLDNVYKSITDALNGVAYPDDSQIVYIQAVRKVWDEKEFISVWLTEEADDGCED